MKIGIAGTGRMGAAMAVRLMNCGHELTVWNRTAEKTAALAAAGAKVAVTPAVPNNVRLQLPVPLQPPVQPVKTDCMSGTAVS